MGEALALETLRQSRRNLSRFVSVAGGVTGGRIENPEQFLSEDFIDAFLPSMLRQAGPITGEPSPREKTLARRILRESISSFIEGRDTLAQTFHSLECAKYFVSGSDDSCQGGEGFNKKFFIPSAGHNVVIEESEKFNEVLAQILGKFAIMTTTTTKEWFTTIQLDDGVFGIGEFGHYEEVLSFLVVGEEEAVLIDSGMGLFSIRSEVRKITPLACGVLNTHSHFDHVGSNFEFSQVELFDHHANRQAAEGGYSADFLSTWFTDQQFLGNRPVGIPEAYTIPSFKHARFFKDRDVLNRASFNFTVLHTPGHSDDSVCFYEPSRGWLFAGDLFYDGPIYIEKVGGLAKYRKSIDRILSLSGIRKIFCSHNAFEFPFEKVSLIREALAKIDSVEIEEEVSLGGRLTLLPG